MCLNQHSGIHIQEFEKILRDLEIGLSESEALMSFMVLDTNNDGVVCWEDFASWYIDLDELWQAKYRKNST